MADLPLEPWGRKVAPAPPDLQSPIPEKPERFPELDALTDRIEAARIVTELKREGKLSLLGKMKALTDSAENFNKTTEVALDGIADKILAATVKRTAAVDKHHGYYDTLIKGIEDSVVVIDRLSNGPLSEDGGS